MHDLSEHAYNSKTILNNLELVFKSSDITKLNKPTYTFVSLMSGFIAHYGLYGFQSTYEDVSTLLQEIAESIQSYTPDHAYEVQSYGQIYADSKKAIYDALPALCEKYTAQVQNTSKTKMREALENVYALLGETLKRNDPEIERAMIQKLELSY
jgi:hypothetical protein